MLLLIFQEEIHGNSQYSMTVFLDKNYFVQIGTVIFILCRIFLSVIPIDATLSALCK